MTGQRLTDLSFDDWLEHAFGHAVPFQGQAWYFAPDCDWWDPTPEQAVEHFARLFEQPSCLVESFTDSQIAQGFWYLLNDAPMHSLIDASVTADHRARTVQSMSNVFREIFDPRCAPVLSHRDETGANALNGICYMWWDITPIAAAPKPGETDAVQQACLDVMRETLALPNPACQESALHGLGHWTHAYPDFATAAIDAYLARHPRLRPELRGYALAARSGCVQ